MENRERDRVSQRTSPTEAGRINRQVEEEKGREHHSGTTAEFGQNIGRSENLSEGDPMRNRNNEDVNRSSSMDRESTRRPESESYGSSSRSGSMGNKNSDRNRKDISDRSDISEDSRSSRRDSSGELGSTGSSSGRH
jgi:hypothetical protein